MWRYDAGRTAASPEELPAELHVQWERAYTPRTPVWDDPLNQDLMRFDAQFEPIIVGDTVILGFNDMDAVVGLDLATGEERWRFYLNGPTRLPPAAWQDRVFVPSDDGRLYCLDIRDGTPQWIFDAAPYDRLLLGNRRLISTWPVRGGPVVMDGVVYFAAGIWPFMGTFLYALDADTGKVVWLNDGNGPQWMVQPHNASSFAGVGPQGALVIAGDALLIPGGRSVPACFDRATGAFRHYEHGANNKTGGAFVAALGGIFFNHHRDAIVSLYETATGKKLAATLGRYPVLTPSTFYFSGASVTAVDAAQLLKTPDKVEACRRWTVEADASGDLIRAGARLYAGGDQLLTAIDAPEDGSSGRIAWQQAIAGKVRRLAAGNGILVAVTDTGRIVSFGGQAAEPRTFPAPAPAPVAAPERHAEAVELLRTAGVREGYALCYGVNDAEFLKALLKASDLHIIAVDSSAERVAALRRQLDVEGLRGDRLAVLPGDIKHLKAPAYLAALTIVREPKAAGFLPNSTACLERLFHAMRPYGGVALIQGLTANERKTLLRTTTGAGLYGLRVAASGDNVLLIREGPLEGAASWTHILGDVAQSGKSDDLRVKLPLGLLWFGGNSHVDVLPRHGHGPPEQILGGRLFIEGMDCLSARDVYTGRVLWKTALPGLETFGTYYNATYRDEPTNTSYNQVHIPGANARGTNFVVTPDAVYVVEGVRVQMLDAETGEKLRRFSLPPAEGATGNDLEPEWGYIGVYEDVLLGGADAVKFSDVSSPQKGKEAAAWELLDRSAGKRLAALDRHTGELRWQLRAQHAFLNNGIVAGDGLVFCLDKAPPSIEGRLKRRGQAASGGFRLLAVDILTGEVRWQTTKNVFGSFLCYSKEHGVLIQSTRPSRDSLPGEEGKRMIAYRGSDGSVLWDRETAYRTFPLLHGEQIVTEGNIFHLMTGEPVPRLNPLTGAEMPWQWRREYGCNYPIASEFLLTFRSGAAGFCDFSGSGGTGNLGGFRSSCTSNLVAADGLLNAPDYTRTCSCSYQNQTSLAMIHDPAVEMWTYNDFQMGEGPVRQVGINFGAPGDRLADNGTLWLDYPSVGGPSPEVGVRSVPDAPKWFRHHSSRYTGEALRWVAASGAEGLSEAHIALGSSSDAPRRYTVRLYFAEPEDLEIGERVFDVSLQGKPVLRHFDLVKNAGGPRCAVVKEFKGIAVKDDLAVALHAVSPGREPLLCGVEAIAEGW